MTFVAFKEKDVEESERIEKRKTTEMSLLSEQVYLSLYRRGGSL